MPLSSSVPSSQEWKLLKGLAGLRDLLRVSHFARAKRPQQLKNDSRKIDIQLRRLLFELLQILEDLDFKDDPASGDSVKQAIEQLPTLCGLLECQTNKDLISSFRPDGSKYPNLTTLVENLLSPPGSYARFGLVSYTKGTYDNGVSALFLTTRVKQARETVDSLEGLNGILTELKLCPIPQSTRKMHITPIMKEATLSSTSAYGQYLRKAIAAFHAMFSGFAKCQNAQYRVHQLLFHLPTLSAMRPDTTTGVEPELGMFLTCPSSGWQEANVELISVIDGELYRSPSLCNAMDVASKMGTGLVFHVEHDGITLDYTRCQARILKGRGSIRKIFTSYPGPENTLRNLLESAIFLPPLGDIDLESPDDVPWAERRSLAMKLLVGMLISLEGLHAETSGEGRHHIIESWDSRKIYLMEVPNGERHVSCNVDERTTLGESVLLLPKIPESDELTLNPSPALTVLAKTLLEICFGPAFDYVKVDSEADYLRAWNILDKAVDKHMKRMADIHIRPLFEAARACLDFHALYEADLNAAASRSKQQNPSNPHVDPIAIAKDTFIRLVIEKLLTTELPPLENSLGGALKPVVSLFDDSEDWGQNTREANWAEKFFSDFQAFRDSYRPHATVPFDPGCELRSRQAVKVAIIDTGFDKRHGSLKSIDAKRCWSWLNNSTNVNDLDGHGTYCAHIVHKTAPDAELYVAQTFSGKSFNLAEAKYIEKAIRHAVNVWQVDIISMSFGLQEPSSEDDRAEWDLIVGDIKKAVIYAASKNVLMFVAASNNGKTHKRTFPATMPQVVCMHAHDGNANDGGVNPPAKDGVFNFATLGVAIKSPRFHAADHAYKSGTSFATPIAAGVAAVMLDFARRTTFLKADAKNGLRTVDGVREMFLLMSIPDGTSGKYLFIAPWQLWTENWQVNPGICSEITSKINNTFVALAQVVEFPQDTI